MPNLFYRPAKDYFGSDSFIYQANDGQLDSAPATVSLTIKPVDDPPSFAVGLDPQIPVDQQTTDESGAQQVMRWATEISVGPANEAGQTVQFLTTGNTNRSLFSAPPAVQLADDGTGTLTFTPRPNLSGTSTITIVLQDSGGAKSAAQTFKITVDKPHPLHNAANPLNVLGCVDPLEVGPPCTYPTASDVIAVINYINARGSGPVPPIHAAAPPYPDVTADNYVAADDVVTIINYMNAHPMIAQSEPEAVIANDDAILLLSMDVAGQGKRKV
jgi:hypothetical protein